MKNWQGEIDAFAIKVKYLNMTFRNYQMKGSKLRTQVLNHTLHKLR